MQFAKVPTLTSPAPVPLKALAGGLPWTYLALSPDHELLEAESPCVVHEEGMVSKSVTCQSYSCPLTLTHWAPL
jgi:hypothetical protein